MPIWWSCAPTPNAAGTRLRSDPLRELDDWLQPYRRTWARRLDALGTHLDTMTDKTEENHG